MTPPSPEPRTRILERRVTCYGACYVTRSPTLLPRGRRGSRTHTHCLTYLLTRNEQQHNNLLLIGWGSGKACVDSEPPEVGA